MSKVAFEGLGDFVRDALAAVHELEEDLLTASTDAADEAVTAMQTSHPYTDRTYNLSGNQTVLPVDAPDGGREAELHVVAPYATFVNDGTRRSAAYPFIPLGEETAERELNERARAAVDTFTRKVGG